jgi:hypothetical protein
MLVEWIQYGNEYCDDLENVSIFHNEYHECTADDFGPQNFFVDDPRGYSSIFD